MGTIISIPAPRYGLFNSGQVFNWSNGSPFSGFALIGLVFPTFTSGADSYGEIDYGSLYPSLGLPRWQRVPILFGSINTSCGLFVNNDLTPPGSQYICYYYDSTGRQIAGPSSPFTVAAGPDTFPGGNVVGPVNLPVLTLTVPSLVGPLPVPDTGPGADGDA